MSQTTPNLSPGFCVAPWLELILNSDGQARTCGRNRRSFGDWRKTSLADIWRSEGYAAFRKDIARGHFPDAECEGCYRGGTSQSFMRILALPVGDLLREIRELPVPDMKIGEMWEVVSSHTLNHLQANKEAVHDILSHFRDGMDRALLYIEAHSGSTSQRLAAEKLRHVATMMLEYLGGETAPAVVGAFRQAQLIKKCNARCVMCQGKFTRDIFEGQGMTEADLEHIFASDEHIVDFFATGSEILLFKGWQKAAEILKRRGNKIRFSTNGILLTPENVRHLIDNDYVTSLNVSMNGSSKEVIERVQDWVKHDKLMANIEGLLEYASEKKVKFPIGFSFVVMQSTYHELPAHFRFVGENKKKFPELDLVPMLIGLENMEEPEYRRFLHEEHPALVSRQAWKGTLLECEELAKHYGVVPYVYNFSEAADGKSLLALAEAQPVFAAREGDFQVLREIFHRELPLQLKAAGPGLGPEANAASLREHWQQWLGENSVRAAVAASYPQLGHEMRLTIESAVAISGGAPSI